MLPQVATMRRSLSPTWRLIAITFIALPPAALCVTPQAREHNRGTTLLTRIQGLMIFIIMNNPFHHVH